MQEVAHEVVSAILREDLKIPEGHVSGISQDETKIIEGIIQGINKAIEKKSHLGGLYFSVEVRVVDFEMRRERDVKAIYEYVIMVNGGYFPRSAASFIAFRRINIDLKDTDCCCIYLIEFRSKLACESTC